MLTKLDIQPKNNDLFCLQFKNIYGDFKHKHTI